MAQLAPILFLLGRKGSDFRFERGDLLVESRCAVGDGIVLQAKDPDNSGAEVVIKRTLVARSGSRIKLNEGLRSNVWLAGNPTCASLFPLLTSERTHDVWIENLALDGSRANCENFNGNYGGCVFIQDCSRYTFRNLVTRNYNGDGISFQVCHDIVVEGCHCHDNADLGVHPGSGSQRPLIRDNRLVATNNGSNTVSVFFGSMISTIKSMMCRGVRNCPASPCEPRTDSRYSNASPSRSL